MNPYAPPTTDNSTVHVHGPITSLLCFAFPVYLTYVAYMMLNHGINRTLAGLSAGEACVVLGIASVSGLIVAVCLDSNIDKNALFASRTLGGIAFGLGFVTCQPYVLPTVLPLVWHVVSPITRLPIIEEFARPIFTLLSEQPYIILPTIMFAALSAWSIERLFRIWCMRQMSTNHGMHAESPSKSTLHNNSNTATG